MSSSESVTDHPTTYSDEDVQRDLQWWAAANYLTVGQIYLQANALLQRPLAMDDIKPRLLGHWGTSPGLSMIYCQLNRLINRTDTDWLYVTGPGHGGPALWPLPISRGRTPRSTRRSPRTPTACSACSASSPRQAASPAT